MEKIASLIRQLLAFTRKQVLIPEVIELGAAIVDSLPLLRQFLGPTIELEVETPREPIWVRVDRAQFHQVLINLTINARDAMPEGGRLKIGVTHATAHDNERPWSGVVPGEYGCLTVTDTGQGIEASDLPYIFEPFFTTKSVGQGTGLGLATVHGIVTQSRGYIDVQSAPGQGAQFRVLLPITSGPAPSPVVQRADEETRAAGIRVLVVEDDPVVRDLLIRTLESRKYLVTVAKDGSEAVARLQERLAFDLVLSDIVMPRMGGAELGRILAARYPDLPVIWMSGLPQEAGSRESSHSQLFLQKPIMPEELLSAIASQIATRNSV